MSGKLNTSINIVRRKILLNGLATKSDVCKFLKCGTKKGYEIYRNIQKEVEQEGKINIPDRILAKRLLLYVGLTEQQVLKFAELEESIKKNDSARTESKV